MKTYDCDVGGVAVVAWPSRAAAMLVDGGQEEDVDDEKEGADDECDTERRLIGDKDVATAAGRRCPLGRWIDAASTCFTLLLLLINFVDCRIANCESRWWNGWTAVQAIGSWRAMDEGSICINGTFRRHYVGIGQPILILLLLLLDRSSSSSSLCWYRRVTKKEKKKKT